MKSLLKSTSWKVFLVLFIPLAIPLFSAILHLYQGIIIGTLLCMLIFISWLDSLGTNLYLKLRDKNKLNVLLFKFNITIIVFYLFIAAAIVFIFIAKKEILKSFNPGLILMILAPVSAYTLIGIIHSLFFISKLLVSVETRVIIGSFDKHFVEFLLLLFLPIGIWWLQPRINKIFLKRRIRTSTHVTLETTKE